MKLLFMISTLENDGAERAMSNITTHLPDGVEADILLNSISSHDFPTNANKICLEMKPDSKKGLFYQLRAFIKRIPVLYRLKKNNHYAACISFMESANICNIMTGNRYCKTLVSVRTSVDQDESFYIKYLVRPMVRIFYKKADYVTAVAEGVRNGLIEYFHLDPQMVKTITNGYDVELIRSLKTEDNKALSEIVSEKENFIYVTVGRLTYAKGHWHLIRAFSEVAKACSDAQLVIVGQGEEQEYLESLIHGYRLEKKVHLLKYQNNPFSVLDKCNVYLMPSMFEGYSNALCEALVCGLPCIATDFQSSAREILAPDTPVSYQNKDTIEYAQYGIITPVCSGKKYTKKDELESQEKMLADAMICMRQNPEIYNKYNETAAERGKQFDIHVKVDEWLSLVR